MSEQTHVKELENVVVRFSGDSGDGMQLAGNLFSNISAAIGERKFPLSPIIRPRYALRKELWAVYRDSKYT